MKKSIVLNTIRRIYFYLDLVHIQDNGNYANSMAADYNHILPNNADDSHGSFDCFSSLNFETT